jgi:hypothetical protein
VVMGESALCAAFDQLWDRFGTPHSSLRRAPGSSTASAPPT